MLAAKTNTKEKSVTSSKPESKKAVVEEAAPQIQLNPLWHGLATHVGNNVAAGASDPPPIQRKSSHPTSVPHIQRLCAECDEELNTGAEPPIQTKLTVGAPDDPYEKEADAVADKVMRTPVGGGQDEYQGEVPSIQSKPFAVSPIQRMCAECEEEPNSGTPDIQKKPNNSPGDGQSSAPDSVMSTINSPGSGCPLSESIRSRVEPVLGADLSSVRVHTDSQSQLASRNIQAKAFTHGNNIFLGAGQSHHDVKLMAHEATHTVQQGGASPASSDSVQKAKSKESDRISFVVQSKHSPRTVFRDPDPALGDSEALLQAAGIDTRSFSELWEEFESHRRSSRSAQALALVPTLLVRMNAEQTVAHAAELAFWLFDQGEMVLARRAIDELDSAWWILYVLITGPGVPTTGIFPNLNSPSTLIDRAEILAGSGSHTDAIRLLALAHLFLEMQEMQTREENQRQFNEFGDLLNGTIISLLAGQEIREIQSQRRRALNLYPRLARDAMNAGSLALAEQMTQRAELLYQQVQQATLINELPTTIGGGVVEELTTPTSRPTGRRSGSTQVSSESPPSEVMEFEETQVTAAPQPPSRAEPQILASSAPYLPALLMQMPGNSYYFVAAGRHAITGSLAAAINMANTLYPTTGAVIAQRLGNDPITFVIAPIRPAFKLSDLRISQVTGGGPNTIGTSGTVFPMLGENTDHYTRAVVTTNGDAIFMPGGLTDVRRVDSAALLENLGQERDIDRLEGRANVPPELIQDQIFVPIDTLIASGNSDDLEAAADQLSLLNATAFSVLSIDQRETYLTALIESWTRDPEERAFVELLKSIPTRVEFDAVVERLQNANIWSRLVEDIDSQLWSLLITVGQRFGDPGPLPASRVFSLLLESGLSTPIPGVVIGPDGPEIEINVIAELQEAARSFVRFLGTTLDAIVMLITEPGKVIEGIAQLVKMAVMFELAKTGYPPAVEFRNQILQRVGESVINGLKGLDLMRDLVPAIVRRAKWALIWEIASLFIGVGEINAVLKGMQLGDRAASLARFVRLLGLGGRVAETEEVVSQLGKLATVMRRSSQVLHSEDEILNLLAHLPEDDATRLANALDNAEIDDAGDLARLTQAHSELGQLASNSLDEIEAMSVFAAKAGALSDDVVRAYRHLRARQIPAVDVADILRAIPDGEGARFARAMRGFEDMSTVSRPVLRSVAESPSRMNAVHNFGGRTYQAAYQRAAGNTQTLDQFIAVLDSRRSTMTANDFQSLLDDLAAEEAIPHTAPRRSGLAVRRESDLDVPGEVMRIERVDLAQAGAHRVVVSRVGDAVEIWMCTHCGRLLGRIDTALTTISTTGPTRSLHTRLSRLSERVADIERRLARGSITVDDLPAELNQVGAHLRDLSRRHPDVVELVSFGDLPISPTMRRFIRDTARPTVHILASRYTRGKHVRGTTNAQRRTNSAGGDGQFLRELDDSTRVTDTTIEAWERQGLQLAREGRGRVDGGGGTYHCYVDLGFTVGYADGIPTSVMRVEWTSGGHVHSHPRPRSDL